MSKPKQAFIRGRRVCMFCQKNGKSKEHVFPDWLREMFPRYSESTHVYGTVDPSHVINIPKLDVRPKQGHGGTVKIKSVCEPCNTGWMSRLEERTKPLLISLIKGQRTNLDVDGQKLLATWAAKTAMTAEQVRPRENGISQPERTFLMDKLCAPSTWTVWIAYYEGTSWGDLAITQNRGRLQNTPISFPGVQSHYVHATTWVIGRVAFLVVGTALETVSSALARFDGKGLFRIWLPLPRSIIFPPADKLGDPQINAVANILTESGVFDNSANPLKNWYMGF